MSGSDETTNEHRAFLGDLALKEFSHRSMTGKRNGVPWGLLYDTVESVAVDLIADILHFAEAHGDNPASIIQRASQHYIEERWSTQPIFTRAEDVAATDEFHRYNKAPFICQIESRQQANVIAAAAAGLEFAKCYLVWAQSMASINRTLPGMETLERKAQAFVERAEGWK